MKLPEESNAAVVLEMAKDWRWHRWGRIDIALLETLIDLAPEGTDPRTIVQAHIDVGLWRLWEEKDFEAMRQYDRQESD